MSIKLKLEGFDELLKNIEKAGGEIDRATENAMRQSAVTMQRELVAQMTKANVDRALISRMPSFVIEKDHGAITARVGYRSTGYNPSSPSDYHKAIFINYGTPTRSKHGVIVGRGFVQKAKRRARRTIKKQQEEVLNKILARLKGR